MLTVDSQTRPTLEEAGCDGPRPQTPVHNRRGRGPLRITVLIPAHNEEADIEATVRAALAQSRKPERVVVIADNCTDRTVQLCRAIAGVEVFETVGNTHKKSGALNQAWTRTRDETDLYVCLDADTQLPGNAVADWERDFCNEPYLGGSSAKFTMMLPEQLAALGDAGVLPEQPAADVRLTWRERMWVRVQRAEFAKWTDTALRRKGQWTSVLAGTACAIRAAALDRLVAKRAQRGEEPLPWCYTSDVEDFELTYRLRELAYYCKVAPSVRAYTGAMRSLRTLWAQRMKWQGGTCADLRRFGLNRLTLLDWWQQFLGLFAAFSRVLWVGLLLAELALFHHLRLMEFWWVFPAVFALFDVRESLRVPHRTWQDLATAVALLPQELFAWIRAGWFVASWAQVLAGRRKDRWAMQIAAETGEGR